MIGSLRATLGALARKGAAFQQTAWPGRLKAAGLALVGAYLVWRLAGLDWPAVATALPLSPWFYGVYIVMFLALPASEVVVYSVAAGRRLRGLFPVFIRKRVFNEGVAGYFGEVYLYTAFRARGAFPDGGAFAAVRDVNILSALASNLMTLAFLVALYASGQAQSLFDASGDLLRPVLWLVAASMAVGIGLVLFGGKAMALSRGRAAAVFAVNLARVVLIISLQIAQWAIALPHVALATWLVFATLYFVVKRIPFLPNADLVFLGLALSLTGLVPADEAAVAAMLLAAGALPQIAYLIGFLLTGRAGRAAA